MSVRGAIGAAALAAVAFASAGAVPAGANDGVPYAGFNGDGELVFDLGGTGFSPSSDAVLDGAGRLLVAGSSGSDIGVARVNPDGTLDQTFSGDGVAVIDSGPTSGGETGRAVAVQPDGKIVIAASASVSPDFLAVVARLNEDGTLDATFDGPGPAGNGVFRLTTTGLDFPSDIALDGAKIVVALFRGQPSVATLVRLNGSDGSYDTSFDADGRMGFTMPGGEATGTFPTAIAVQPDHKIVVSAPPNGAFGLAVARVGADGALDAAGFGSADGTPDGMVRFSAPAGYFNVDGSDIELDPNGDIYVAATAEKLNSPNSSDAVLVRLTPAGAIDPAFGSSGYAFSPFTEGPDFADSVVRQPGGELIVGGSIGADPVARSQVALRFTPAGALDPEFGGPATPGAFVGDLGRPADVHSLALSPLGVAYLVGQAYDEAGGSPIVGVQALSVEAPPPPNLFSTEPAGPANDNQPLVKGNAFEAVATITLYASADCSGAPIGAGTRAELEGGGIAASVPDNATTEIFATASSPGGTSECSSGPSGSVTYQEVTPPPAAPVLTGVSPAGPANDNQPHVLGTAVPGTTVTLYGSAACTGSVLGSGPAAALASPGIAISVPDNSTTRVFATATAPGGELAGTSPCSASSVTYTEQTPPPLQPGPKPHVTTKRCPKGKKLIKKKRCVKKKKRKK